MTTRRNFIKILGGGTILAASAAIGLTAFPIGVPDATRAWRNPGMDETDIRRKALSYAILAPNPHNMQPWLVDLSVPNEALLFLDHTRLLPATDPYSRQITLGCGAFLELLTLAAHAHGAEVEITSWPQGEPGSALDNRPFAHVAFRKGAVTRDPLFDQIPARRTNREPYDTARIPASRDLEAIVAEGSAGEELRTGFTNEPARVAALRDMVWRGWKREMATPASLMESVNVMRIGDRAIAAHRDGLSLGGPMMNLMAAAGMITRETLLDPTSEANAQGASIWKEMAETAPAFLWLASDDNTRHIQITAGRAYARLNLAATARGLSMHPWSMALQEYPEMADLYTEQQAMLGGSAHAPIQMLVRIGYAPEIAPAPRRGLGYQIKT